MAERRGRATWIAAVVGLCAVTLWFFTLTPLHRAVGPDLLTNSFFAEGLEGWRAEGPSASIGSMPGLVELSNSEPSRQIGLRQTVVMQGGEKSLKLQAAVAAADIVPGPKTWHGARVYAVPLDGEGDPQWGRLTVLTALRGDAAWRSDEIVLDLPDGSSAVRVGIQMAWTTGQMQVRDISLAPVEQRDFVAPVKAVLACAWAVLATAMGWRLWRAMPTHRERLAFTLPLGLLVAGILMPESIKAAFMALLLGSPASEGDALLTAAWVQAISHFTLFALVAGLMRLLRPAGQPVVQAALLALLAMTTEVLQFFSDGRTPGVTDWLIDVSGIATGMALAGIVSVLRSWRSAPVRTKPPGSAVAAAQREGGH